MSPTLQADSLPDEVPRRPNGSIILIQNCCYLVAKSCLTLLRLHGPPARLLCPWASLVAQTESDKESACQAGDLDSTSGLGKSPGEGNSNPLQYSCLGNPLDRGAWRNTVHNVTKSCTLLSE